MGLSKVSLKKFLILLLLFSCSNINSKSYEIKFNNSESKIDSRLVINVEYLQNDLIKVTSQMFPKVSSEIESYKLVYDMKFR